MSGLASDYALEHDVYISPIVKDMDIWEKIGTMRRYFIRKSPNMEFRYD
jgi:hypothetical protein